MRKTICLSVLPLLLWAHDALPASFQGLGDYPPRPGSGPGSFRTEAVSADGSTVVGQSGYGQAFRWTAETGMARLGGFPDCTWGESGAFDVSADGSVTVGYAWHDPDPTEACLWTADGEIVGLGKPPGGKSFAYAVSADGSVVIVDGVTGPSNDHEVFRWTAAEGLVSLGEGSALDISADGSVIFCKGLADPTVDDKYFLWTAESGRIGLNNPMSSRRNRCGISADGSTVIVGNRRWTAETGWVDLGFGARAVSADGSIVLGEKGHVFYGAQAQIWDEINGSRNLKEVLTNDYGLDLSDWWDLDAATGISDDGTVIVGYGTNPDGHIEAFRAVIPEPSTLAGLLTAAALALVVCARRRRR
ncbi:MAG: PEP-CTERM sorting domain-containing protein [Planctomycetota bacterium]|jgi:uncharacterized membrane protein